MKIGYWGIKGKAEVLRYIASYLKYDFEDKLYTSREEWLKDKEE